MLCNFRDMVRKGSAASSWHYREALSWNQVSLLWGGPGHISCQTRAWGSLLDDSSPSHWQPATIWETPSENHLAGCTQPPGLWEMITYGIAVSCHWSWGCFDTQQSITRTETFPRNTGEPLLEWSFTISVFGHLLLKQWPRCVFSLNPPSTQAAYLLKASLCLSILMLLKILAVKRNV